VTDFSDPPEWARDQIAAGVAAASDRADELIEGDPRLVPNSDMPDWLNRWYTEFEASLDEHRHTLCPHLRGVTPVVYHRINRPDVGQCERCFYAADDGGCDVCGRPAPGPWLVVQNGNQIIMGHFCAAHERETAGHD
jgi:hypothetical protein